MTGFGRTVNAMRGANANEQSKIQLPQTIKVTYASNPTELFSVQFHLKYIVVSLFSVYRQTAQQ